MIDLLKVEKDLYKILSIVKNFFKKIPDTYLNLLEKKLIQRLLFLIGEEKSPEEIDKYINIIKFINDCEIFTTYSLNILKLKLEKNSKLTPKMFAFFFKINL